MNALNLEFCPFPKYPSKPRTRSKNKKRPSDAELSYLISIGWRAIDIANFSGYNINSIKRWRYHINVRPSYGIARGITLPIFPLNNYGKNNVQKTREQTLDASKQPKNITMSQ